MQSHEERHVLWSYHATQCGRAIVSKDTQSLEQWAQDGIRNPAPLLEWYAKDYPTYLARKSKIKATAGHGFTVGDTAFEFVGPRRRKRTYTIVST